jgi:hypothetical protein
VHGIGSILVTPASVPLALGVAAGVMVAIGAIAKSVLLGAGVAALALITLVGLWFVAPLVYRGRLQQ